MLKPNNLREHLTQSVPELANDPNKLVLLACKGRILSTGTPSLSYEYAYTLQIAVKDYSGHSDAIMVPLLAWAKRQQPDLFDNPELQRKGLRFDIDFLTPDTANLYIELDLTECVLVRQHTNAPEGTLNVIYPDEPTHPGDVQQRERWSLWLREQFLAEWNFDPRIKP